MAVINHEVTRFKSLSLALKELEPFIRNGEHLQTGKPFKSFGDMRSREILGNWLLCVAVNSGLEPGRLTFTSQPRDRDGDGIIIDTVTGETVLMEHIIVPRQAGGPEVDIEELILKAVKKKRDKGGAAYASGKTLVVLREAAGKPWLPKSVASRLPADLAFDAVWVVGLDRVEDGRYIYWVTRLDLSRGVPPVWRVTIGENFDSWTVEPAQ